MSRFASVMLVFIAFTVCPFLSCRHIPLPVQAIDSTQQPLWKIDRNSGGIINGEFPQFMNDQKLITYTEAQGNSVIIALNKDTGKELWRWSDTFDTHTANTNQVHVYQNILVWRRAGRIYAIDLNLGKTLWKQRVFHSGGFVRSGISGIGERFIFNTGSADYFSGFSSQGNVSLNPILKPSVRTNHADVKVFLNTQTNFVPQASLNDTLTVLPYSTPDGEAAIFFTMYNLTKGKEIYTKIMVGDTSGAFSYPPSVHNGKIYFPAGAFVLCFDLKTGNELWRTRFGSIFFQSGLVIYNNKIYCNNNDGNSYCLDTETGKILWQTRTRGGCSLPFYLNGVVYFTSIADGRLYGLDANDGKILMNIEDPRGGIGFQDVVTGVGDKIFAATYTTLYCFKAAR